MFFFGMCLLLVHLGLCQRNGWVTSPEHPLSYPNNSRLNWTQCANEGFSISLSLIHLDIENSTNCENDVLMIFIDNHLVKSLCGSISFKKLQSSVNLHLLSTSGGCLSLYFRSDESIPQLHTGFRAFYKIQDVDECASQKNPCSHFCYNFIGGFRCSCRLGYILNPKTNKCYVINCGEPKSLPNGHVQFIKGTNNEYQSVVKYACNEPFYSFKEKQNVNFLCDAKQQWRTNGSGLIPSCYPVCGQHSFSIGRIWGGKTAVHGSFPWQVLLYVKNYLAGGFIIGEKWIMTAAHNFNTCPSVSCLKVKTTAKGTLSYVVYAGHNVLKQKQKFIAPNVSSIHIHPNFNQMTFDNDIALIKLHTSITFSQTVRPVCLPSVDLQMRGMGMVSGFGLTENGTTEILQYVELPIVSQEDCRKSFRSGDSMHATDNMFCAGFEMGGKDSCTGDSGSAFVKKVKGILYAVGIVSWGRGCALENEYGVYTRVSRYLDWINKTMSEH